MDIDELQQFSKDLLTEAQKNDREVMAAAALITLGMVELAKAFERNQHESSNENSLPRNSWVKSTKV